MPACRFGVRSSSLILSCLYKIFTYFHHLLKSKACCWCVVHSRECQTGWTSIVHGDFMWFLYASDCHPQHFTKEAGVQNIWHHTMLIFLNSLCLDSHFQCAFGCPRCIQKCSNTINMTPKVTTERTLEVVLAVLQVVLHWTMSQLWVNRDHRNMMKYGHIFWWPLILSQSVAILISQQSSVSSYNPA